MTSLTGDFETPRQLTADRGDAGKRLDLVLRRHLSHAEAASRAQIQSWIEQGHVTVNGVCVRRVSARAAAGDIVVVTFPASRPRRVVAAEDTTLDVLFEDDHLLAINKPAGIVVHPTYKHMDGTMMNALLWRARAWPAGQRPSLVGRLDKLTSGIVLVARTAAIHAALQRVMASARAEKDYLALVYGRVSAARGDIDLRLGRAPRDRRRVVASPTAGVHSLTRFERLARVAAPRVGLSLLRCRLVTGRMHQIRAHLAARGWPIVGDPSYGEPRWSQVTNAALADVLRTFPRQALHAWHVAFVHPVTHALVSLEAPLPDDFKKLLMASGLSDTTEYAAAEDRGPSDR